MKKIICFLLLISCFLHSNSQNLVPNGDFEYYTSCPTNQDQLNLAFPWYDPNGATPDYFNGCASITTYINVPNQTSGIWQQAHSGVAYAGIWARQNVGSNYREYIQVKLTDTLIQNRTYAVAFYTNLYNKLRIGVNNIGAYISQTALTNTAPNPLGFTPQILLAGNPPITDTINWVRVSGNYTATGGEQYITIGNFQNDTNTISQVVDNTSSIDGAYYYIDDVSVVAINVGIDEVAEEKRYFKLYPNPSKGSMVLQYHINENDAGIFRIFDVTGKLIKSYNFNSSNDNAVINADEIDAGIYLYDVLINNNKVKTDKLIIIK